MAEQEKQTPDLTKGVGLASIPDGSILAGTVGEEAVLLTRTGAEVRAFGAKCTHLGAPLAQGLLIDESVRCPWHHACFSLKSGEALRAPAFDALPRWVVERTGETVTVTGKADRQGALLKGHDDHGRPGMVIVGGGAAGYAAAHELRRLGHEGPITMVSNETNQPYDRTLLTKDYLDGAFGDDRLPIAQVSLDDLGVMFAGGIEAETIDTSAKHLVLKGGRTLPYTKLLLATGAEANALDVPGCELAHVHVLRSLADCRAILDRLKPGTRVAVVGSSFIGLEAAASIRSRGLDVTVLTPETAPLTKVVGPELSRAIMAVHTRNGVIFRLNATMQMIGPDTVRLADGSSIPADLVVVGIGVRPRTGLAEKAGLSVEDGVVVDGLLRTSDPDIYAAGDIARWTDPHGGERIRVEHWVVAERQGQTAACNMLGGSKRYDAVPFFWSKHFDFSFRYLGHAADWDEIAIEGDLDRKNAVIRYRKNGRDRAVATVERDEAALRIERRMEELIERAPAA